MKIKICFSDGSQLFVPAGECLVGILSDGSPMECTPIEIAMHDGMISTLIEFLGKYSYFFVEDERDKCYSTSTIVSLENLED